MMSVPRCVPSAFLLLTAIFLSQAGYTEARTLDLDNDDFDDVLRKRNSWWSKKSVDASSDFRPIVPDSEIDASDLVQDSLGAYSSLFECYTSFCVPDFIACAARSRTTSSYDLCKLSHRSCAVRCWNLPQNGESPMK